MTTKPRLVAPALTCDCHMHIYDPRFRAAPTWPLALPDAPVAAYREVQRELGLSRLIVVQPNGYMFDNACTEDALRQFGDSARGIATIRPDIGETELARLNGLGFRGARCFMLKGGYLSWHDVEQLAARVRACGWHVQLQLDGRELPALEQRIAALPVDVVIDHNGKFLEPVPTSHPAFASLLRLLDSGRVWVKLSAPYETSKTGAPAYEDVSALARAGRREAGPLRLGEQLAASRHDARALHGGDARSAARLGAGRAHAPRDPGRQPGAPVRVLGTGVIA